MRPIKSVPAGQVFWKEPGRIIRADKKFVKPSDEELQGQLDAAAV